MLNKITRILTVAALLTLPAFAHADADDPVADFEQVHGQLQQLTQRGQEIREAHANAQGDERQQLQDEYLAIFGEIQSLTPRLADATIAAYAAAPGHDQAEATIAAIAQYLVESDRFEQARQATQLMVDHDHPHPQRHALAGTAAFAVGDFVEAVAYFDTARDAGALPANLARFADPAEDYIDYGREEQQIREAEAEADDLPRVHFETTAGDIVIELFEDHAPNTVANFISLVEDGYYDGLAFHRVLPNFMAQGGCPEGTGTGGPGYHIPCELDNDYRRHFRGTLSMAHAGTDTGGSQFFLTFLPTHHLNGRHTAFGRVIEGLDTLAEIERADPQRPNPSVEPSRIIEATVLRKRDHDYDFTTVD